MSFETVIGLGEHTFPSAGWQNITSFQWDATGSMIIDNLLIEAQPVEETLDASVESVDGSGVELEGACPALDPFC